MNNILRRWHNLQTTWGFDSIEIKNIVFILFSGYVELSYQFPSSIAFGTYTIRCEAQQSVQEKTFLVDFFRETLNCQRKIIVKLFSF